MAIDLDSIRATLAASGVDEKLVAKVVAQVEADVKAKANAERIAKVQPLLDEYKALVKGFIESKAFQAVVGKLGEALAGAKYGFTGELASMNGPSVTMPGVPTAKARASGSGGSGKSKTEFGMSLDEIAKAFGTESELAKVTTAEAMPTGSARSNATFSAKDAIKRRAIKDGLLLVGGTQYNRDLATSKELQSETAKLMSS